MAETETVNVYADADLVHDVQSIIVRYPPLVQDRRHIHVSAAEGVVTIEGHVRTSVSWRYLLSELERLPAIKGAKLDKLYSDQLIRLEIGRVIPAGVIVAGVRYGRVILFGKPPKGKKATTVVNAVKKVAGVVDVTPMFVP